MNLAAFIDFLRQQSRAIKEAWSHLTRSAQVMIVGIGFLVAASIAAVSMTGGETRYITLADNLNATQIAETVSLLDSKGIPYRLDETQRTISVLPKDRGGMLLELERNNLPVGQSVPTGFEEIFASPDLMSNQWLNDINFMRAIQGELQKQLNLFDFVDYSHVLIREADQELFVDEQIPSEAAVTLAVNRPVSKEETKLIVSMVSRAGGPNLHPGNIVVTTTDGKSLHLPSESEFASIANDKLEFQNEVERRIEDKISSRLSKMGVQGTVMVSADISFDHKDVTEDVVTEGTPLSEWTQNHEMESTERLPEGAPGALQNVPEAAAAPGGTQTKETTKDELVNYEPSRLTTRTRTEPGDVLKYKIALVVQGDDTREVENETGEPTQEYVGITESLRGALTALAESAVSIDGVETEVSIVDHPFNIAGLGVVSEAIASREAAEYRAWTGNLVSMGIQLFLILVGLFAISRLLRNSIIIPGTEEDEEEVREIPAATLEDMRRQEVAAEISQLSMDDPEAVAALLRSWMTVDED